MVSKAENNILIIVNTYKDKYNLFVEAGNKLGVNVSVVTFNDIKIKDYNDIKINNVDLSIFNIIYFRVIIRKFKITQTIINYCKNHKIAIEDESLKNNLIYSKLYDQALLENDKLATIKTEKITIDNLDEKIKLFSFPVVTKVDDSSQGNGVKLCKNIDEIKNMFSEFNKMELILQEYIENDGDLRVLVLGNKIIGAMKRSSNNENEFRNNVSLGGKSIIFETTEEIKNTSIAAAKSLNYGFAGVDLIYDSQKRNWKILEVNRAPQFAGFMKTLKINVAELFLKYLIKKYS